MFQHYFIDYIQRFCHNLFAVALQLSPSLQPGICHSHRHHVQYRPLENIRTVLVYIHQHHNLALLGMANVLKQQSSISLHFRQTKSRLYSCTWSRCKLSFSFMFTVHLKFKKTIQMVAVTANCMYNVK